MILLFALVLLSCNNDDDHSSGEDLFSIEVIDGEGVSVCIFLLFSTVCPA